MFVDHDVMGSDAAKVRRRVRSLAVLEAVNIPLQGVAWFGLIGVPFTAANLVGFGLFILLLAQGAAYWGAKLRQLRAHAGHLGGGRAFRAARAIDPVLLAVGVAFCAYAASREPGWASWPGLGFALFAVLEYINYFHVQLSHDNAADLRRLFRVGLRRSHLARDLRRQDRPAPPSATGPTR